MRYPRWYDFIENAYYKLEFFFARRWLNRTFGKKDYWGDWIMERLHDDL